MTALNITGNGLADKVITKSIYASVYSLGYVYQQLVNFKTMFPGIYQALFAMAGIYFLYVLVGAVIRFFMRWTKTIIKFLLIVYMALILYSFYANKTVYELVFGNAYVVKFVNTCKEIKILVTLLYQLYMLSKKAKLNANKNRVFQKPHA